MNIEQLKQFLTISPFGCFKYVSFIDNTFEFGLALLSDHKSMVDNEKIVRGAGFLYVSHRTIEIEGHSISLKIGPHKDDERIISELLNMTIRE